MAQIGSKIAKGSQIVDPAYFSVLRALKHCISTTLNNYEQADWLFIPNLKEALMGGTFKRGSDQAEEKYVLKFVSKYSGVHGHEFLQAGIFFKTYILSFNKYLEKYSDG